AAATPPRVYALDAEGLARAKRRIASGDARLQPAYDRLVREAGAALRVPPASVMDKRRIPPSGDKHDYVSMGPYWWPNPATPGGTQGRAAGIIETRGLVGAVDAIGMLERSPSWTAADDRGMAGWLSAYLGWLRSSAIGKQERSAHNNHGTWYDAQVAALALFTGDTALARSTLEGAKTRRIAAQITPDGRQPYELART